MLPDSGFEVSDGLLELGFEVSDGLLELGFEVSDGLLELGFEVSDGLLELGFEVSDGLLELGFDTSDDSLVSGFEGSETSEVVSEDSWVGFDEVSEGFCGLEEVLLGSPKELSLLEDWETVDASDGSALEAPPHAVKESAKTAVKRIIESFFIMSRPLVFNNQSYRKSMDCFYYNIVFVSCQMEEL